MKFRISDETKNLDGEYEIKDVCNDKLIVSGKGKCRYEEKYKDKIIYCLENNIKMYAYFDYMKNGTGKYNNVKEIAIEI